MTVNPLPAGPTTAQIDRSKSDYPRLLNRLRALLRDSDVHSPSLNRVFIPVGEDSALFDSLAAFDRQLLALKTLIGALPRGRLDAKEISHYLQSGTLAHRWQAALAQFNKAHLDFSKPFSCMLHVAPGKTVRHTYVLHFVGASPAGKTVSCVLPDTYLRLLDVTPALEVISADLPIHRALTVSEGRKLSLDYLLAYYGIDIALFPNRQDLAKAIAQLMPGQSRQPAPAVALTPSFSVPEQPRFVLDTRQVYSFRQRSVEEQGTDDYNVIAEQVRQESQWHLQRYRRLLATFSHFGASAQTNEKALLAMLEQAGGISLKLDVYDSDGQNNIYREQHTSNPAHATDLAGYFADAARELADYMINKIQFGESEGAINIEKLIIQMIVPTLVLRSHNLTPLDIQVFGILAKQPPFLYLDPLAKDAYETISARFTEITHELQKANWDIQQSATLTHAARYLMAHYHEHGALSRDRLHQAANTYYRVVAETLAAQQQLKIILQPTQPEFVSRALCRYLGLEEQHWGVIARAQFDIRYEAGWKNTGSFIAHEKAATYRTLLSVVYDESLRQEIALAEDRETMLAALTAYISKQTHYPGPAAILQDKLAGIFKATIFFVDNDALPEDLRHPQAGFKKFAEDYTIKASDAYRALEAERIVLTASDAARRLRRSFDNASMDSDKAFHCIELLTPAENSLLESRTQSFAAFLRARSNNDDIQDLSSAAQHILRLVRQVGGFIPVLGNFINLAFDIYAGDEEAMAVDGLNIFAELVLLKFRAMPPRVLGNLLLQGTNIWTMAQQAQALKASIKANDYPASVEHFGFLLLGMHSALQCGASIIHGFPERQASAAPDETASEAGDISPAPANAYWRTNELGEISAQPTGRKVKAVDWNGNAIVEGGARAVLLGGINESIYMLNGEAHRPIMGKDGAELRALHTLDLEAGQWRQRPASTQFSRFAHTEDFPSGFSGRAQRRQAAANTASWYDNCVVELETLAAEVTTIDGEKTRQDLKLGVVEQKYVTGANGQFQVLEHAGNADGTTTFIRVDGSQLQVSATLPAAPHYRPEVQARIVAAQGMFVSVEISDTLQGLTGKKTVAGVLATLREGGAQELIIEANRGVHYRGTIAAEQALNLAPGETSTTQQPIALTLRKISADADPKRASPALYRDQPQYRDGPARDDFALELFYGAKAANQAYTRNAQWVEDNLKTVATLKEQLPEPIRTVENPFYILDTQEEQAILFAPRNQAALANTLLGKTIEWGEATSKRSLELGQDLLRKVRLDDYLLSAEDSIAPSAKDRAALVHRLQAALGQENLMLAEVEGKKGAKAYFVHAQAERIHLTAKAHDSQIHLSRTGSLIDHIEAHYPDPSAIKGIVILSLDEVSPTETRRIFLSSQRGYRYESVTSLEQPASEALAGKAELQLQIADTQYAERAREVKVANAVVDLSKATLITSGPRQGAYVRDGRYYLKLDNGKLYRAFWDGSNGVFVLVPPEGKFLANAHAYPWVRRATGNEFTLTNRPGLRGGNWREQAGSPVRTKSYRREVRQGGRMLATQRGTKQEIQVHHEDLQVIADQPLQDGKLNVPTQLFNSIGPDADGYITLESRIEVPESCISSTEYLVSRYAGGTSEFDYEGERSGEAMAVVPNVEVVARQDSREVSLNISTTPLDAWIGGEGYKDYFVDAAALPNIGEGIGFIQRHAISGKPASDYDFHFMFVAGQVLDESGRVTAVLATDLSEPPRKTVRGVATTHLPIAGNWNVKLYRSIAEMRGAADPEDNYYPHEQYYSVLVRPIQPVAEVPER